MSIKNIFLKILGIILIIVGLLALFTPFTPGSFLALIGLAMVLGAHSKLRKLIKIVIEELKRDKELKKMGKK